MDGSKILGNKETTKNEKLGVGKENIVGFQGMKMIRVFWD